MSTLHDPPPLAEKLRRWLEWAVQSSASDLHVVVGHPPVIRIHGDLTALPEPAITEEEAEPLLLSACPHDALNRLQSQKNADFSFECPVAGHTARFRATLFLAGGSTGGCFRVIPDTIPDLAWANFPVPVAEKIAALRDGLVVLTGATGSGKTTTLAMIVNRLNKAGGYRIITVEEPVEYQVPARAKLGRHAARGGGGCAHLCRWVEVRAPPGSRCDPCGRDPRPGDVPDGALCGRNWPPRLQHAPHTRRERGDHAVSGPVPARRAVRGAGATRDEPACHRQSAALAGREQDREAAPGA